MSDRVWAVVAGMPLWVVAVLVVLLLLTIIGVIVLVVRGRNTQRPEREPFWRRFRRPGDTSGLARGAREFHAKLREAFPGAGAHYRLPLFVAVGPDAGATRAAVRQAGLRQPLGETVAAGGLAWTAFDRAAVVEAEPSVLGLGDGSGNRWSSFIGIMQRLRPRRPIDGIILVLPADRLSGQRADLEALRNEAERLRERLGELENKFSMTLPVHCMVAGGEILEGFDELATDLGAAGRSQPLGYTSPHSSKEVYRPEVVEDAIDALAGRTQVYGLEALVERPNGQHGDALFTLPAAIDGLRAGLRTYLDTILQPGQYARLAVLRGLYLSGSAQGVTQVGGAAPFAAAALNERIFPEYSLAEPVHTGLVAANTNVRRAQLATAVALVLGLVGLYAQDSILVNRVPQARSLVSSVADDYRRISIARAEQGASTDIFQEQSSEFVQRLGGLDGDYLRSFFVPSSWLGSLPRAMDRLKTGAYVEILFKSMGRSLQERARAVASGAGGTGTRSLRAQSGASYPAFGSIREQLARLERLATQFEYYQRLRQGREDAFALRQLAQYLYGLELPPEFFPEIDTDLLGASGPGLPSFPLERVARQAQTGFLDFNEQFLVDLTNRHNVSERLRRVLAILTDAGEVSGTPNDPIGRLRRLHGDLSQLQRVFANGRYAWVSREDTVVSENYEDLLARVAEARLLGERVAGRMRRSALSVRRQFRSELTETNVRNLGQLVIVTDDGPSLSGEALAVLQRLKGFDVIVQPDSGGRTGSATRTQVPHPVPRGSYVHWDLTALEDGRRALDNISDRFGEGPGGQPVDRALSKVVRAEKLDAIIAAMRQATRTRPARNDLVSGGPSEVGLTRRAQNFASARPHLGHFIRVLADLNAPDVRRDLLRLAGWEAEKLLGATDRLLADSNLYGMDRAALEAWEGRQGLAVTAFGAQTRDALVGYLAEQRGRLDTLANDYARPALALLYDNASDYNVDRLGRFAKWRVILENLRRYRNGAPGNPIQRLEKFILQDMREATVDSCAQLRQQSDIYGDGYVASRFKSLQEDAFEICQQRRGNELLARYRGLAERFNAQLAGRAPFVSPDDWRAVGAVPLTELASFMRDFDRAMNAGLGDPTAWAGQPSAQSVTDFLDRLDRAFTALRPALARENGSLSLSYELTVGFRVNRADEKAANHILDWRLRVADATRSLKNTDEPLTWRQGEPVELMFRWAMNAPTEPTGGDDIADLSVNGRSAVVRVGGPYAVFGLIARHRSDSRQRGQTLRFEIPLTYRGQSTDAQLQGGRARVFVRLELRAGGRPVRVPTFPTRAPDAVGVEPASQVSRK